MKKREGKPPYFHGEKSLPEENEDFKSLELVLLNELYSYKDILREADDVEGGDRDIYYGSTWNYS